MSGHSKWSQIKRQKGVTDKKRANAFAKIAKIIAIAAHDGDNPTFNFKLRLAIDQAKNVNMPKDNIERAIKKGAGTDTDGAKLEEITYEGFGPNGSAFLVTAITDNRNRSSSFLKSTFSKHGGHLGSIHSVQWMFDLKGVLTAEASEKNELAAIEAGAEDVNTEGDILIIITNPNQLESVKAALAKNNITTANAEVTYKAKDPLQLTPEQTAKVCSLEDEISDNEDVNEIYTNIKE
ncbi:MAG: hypothetical protein A3F54_02340 [Candidatus Kerfeldbacteria bacterium RIFCSPHIGHO2_12_FULL_48_17]|uniref:Probable transcriptional regulatory protein A3F54_02340 n=1 Tax=Candidatus Kerfeldbacteria bacterium RIFCSPHIGHO2_12_FULL_48_17 TaxID=1798542 RepID=A0A1G2B2A9_9BACT|nr:MAG: hypothetical protein A3F54_02340 [Candidatus Kerfeldbacteria bacterium RIFCSPHIGHO2_12_FULL_48_17]